MDYAARQNSEVDVEKGVESKPAATNISTKPLADAVGDLTNSPPCQPFNERDSPFSRALKDKLRHWNAKVESLAGLEARGISRVLPDEKLAGELQDHLQMFSLWLSINMYVYNIITGFLGVLVFSLGWNDCVLIVIFANALAACGVSYTSTFGPESGNRTMVWSLSESALTPYIRINCQLVLIINRFWVDTSWVTGPPSSPVVST